MTKSGTNELHGSAYGYLRNARLARSGSFLANSAFTRELYGFSLGGPIVRDRVHLFLAPELQRAATPARGPYIGQASDAPTPVPAPVDVVNRFASLLRDRGLAAGDGGRVMLPNPNLTVFGRIDVDLPELSSRLVLRVNSSRSEQSTFRRSDQTPVFPLSSSTATNRFKKLTTAVQLFSQVSPTVFNELQLGRTDNPILGVPAARMPSITVGAGAATTSPA